SRSGNPNRTRSRCEAVVRVRIGLATTALVRGRAVDGRERTVVAPVQNRSRASPSRRHVAAAFPRDRQRAILTIARLPAIGALPEQLLKRPAALVQRPRQRRSDVAQRPGPGPVPRDGWLTPGVPQRDPGGGGVLAEPLDGCARGQPEIPRRAQLVLAVPRTRRAAGLLRATVEPSLIGVR